MELLKILIEDEGLTNLRLYAGVVTRFLPPEGDLACMQVSILAEDHHDASVIVAAKHPDWDLQSLTCLSDFAWFKFITIAGDCPQVEVLRDFVIEGIQAFPDC